MERPARPQSVQRAASLRAFVQTRGGKLFLVLVAILTLAASFYYLGPYFAIPTFLLFGLGLPIYLGWKIPRQLAVLGLAAVLLSGPIINYGLTTQAMAPSPSFGSSTNSANSTDGLPVLANATEHPYNAAGGTSFAFSVELHASRLPGNYTPDLLYLYVSTCPGATGPSSPFCGSGYPFFPVNQSVRNDTGSASLLTFHVPLPGPNIWWWQMGLLADKSVYNVSTNKTNTTYQWIFLEVNNAYGAVQGPITGTWLSTYDLLLPQTVIDVLFYPGIVFFIALLIYMWLKRREANKKAARAAASGGGMIPPTSGATPPSETAPPDPAAASARRPESSCPKCGAVVYPKETQCWKCGTPLPGGATAPLRSDS
jgi:hypothetical protein